MSSNIDDAVQSTLIRLGGQVIRALYALVFVAVVVSAGGAAWVTDVNNKLSQVTIALQDLKSSIPQKWVVIKLNDLDMEQKRLQLQIDRIENTVFLGQKKPPLGTYANGE